MQLMQECRKIAHRLHDKNRHHEVFSFIAIERVPTEPEEEILKRFLLRFFPAVRDPVRPSLTELFIAHERFHEELVDALDEYPPVTD